MAQVSLGLGEFLDLLLVQYHRKFLLLEANQSSVFFEAVRGESVGPVGFSPTTLRAESFRAVPQQVESATGLVAFQW